MINIIVNFICALVIVALIYMCGGPKWGAIGLGMISFTIWTAYDLVCAKIDELRKSR